MLQKIAAAKRCNPFMATALFVITSLASCGSDNTPDISGSTIKLKTRRFDLDFAALDTVRPGTGLQSLSGKYPDFLQFFTDTLMGMRLQGNYNDTSTAVMENLRLFLVAGDYRELLDTIKAHYPDTKSIDRDLEKGLKYYHHYFPEQFVPRVVYYPSYLGKVPAVLSGSDVVGVPLDMYLGPEYPFYDAPNINIPAYAQAQCVPEAIPVNVFSLLYKNIYPAEIDNKSLLELMVMNGKQQYFLEKVLPFVDESTRFGMTKEQLKWCEENEASAYNFFVQQNLIYSKDLQKIMRYVTDGPNAMGFPAEAPANIGSWVGYRIVRSYAAENPKMTLPELCTPSDAQAVLQGAHYKPR